MIVTINGEARHLAEGTTVAALVAELGFGERRVAVEINCDVVPRERYAVTGLRGGDVVEIVQFVGGG
jgi:sulfur carrier protein